MVLFILPPTCNAKRRPRSAQSAGVSWEETRNQVVVSMRRNGYGLCDSDSALGCPAAPAVARFEGVEARDVGACMPSLALEALQEAELKYQSMLVERTVAAALRGST